MIISSKNKLIDEYEKKLSNAQNVIKTVDKNLQKRRVENEKLRDYTEKLKKSLKT